MNQLILPVLLAVDIFVPCYAPPVTQKQSKEEEKSEDNMGGLEDYMEYHRYLKEVVNALESDDQFRNKLEKADEHDIRSGKIAEELEFVSHHVRTRLDEIKRVELNRLKDLTEKKRQLQQNIDTEDPTHHHLDHSNPHTFEIEDLKKLIAKTTEDLAEADKKRKEDFKQYELQKEYDKQVKLNHTAAEEREKLEKEYKEAEEKHKKHDKLHEPGHKAQLEEVWQEQDQMQQEFDPKTFFMLHDLDSNGLWDQDEVKALFVRELQKMYAAGEPEDDMRERAEEMERMRESVFKEVDLNRDGFIDYEEFLAQTKRNDFQQDHGWQGLDERKPYTDQELEEYIRLHQANQVPYGYAQPGYHPPPVYQQVPPGHHPNAVPMHPNAPVHPGAIPQQYVQGHPPLNTNEIYPQQGHAPQPQQYQPNQVHYQQQPNYHQPPQQANYQQQPPQQANYQQQQQQQPNHQQQQQQPNYQQQQQPNYQQQQPQHQPQQPIYQQPAHQQPPEQPQQQQQPPRQDQPPQQVPQQPAQGNPQVQPAAPPQANSPLNQNVNSKII